MSQELQIKETLPVLACNFEQMKAWATELTARYEGLLVTEDALVAVKKDMAEINRAKKNVDEARKEIVKRVSEPIRAFEAQIKEIIVIFENSYNRLGLQVKAFEDAQREERRDKVQEIINQCYADAFGPTGPRPNIEIHWQDKWLNKTTSTKSIHDDVQGIIKRHVEEERRRKELEQARQDRAAAIEKHAEMLNGIHNLKMPVSRFFVGMLMNPERPLSDVLADIDQTYADALAQRDKQRKAMGRAVSPPAPVEQTAPAVEQGAAPAPAPRPRAMSVVFEYAPENQAKVVDCLKTLRSLCVSFSTRTR
jgi:hypothetical protein